MFPSPKYLYLFVLLAVDGARAATSPSAHPGTDSDPPALVAPEPACPTTGTPASSSVSSFLALPRPVTRTIVGLVADCPQQDVLLDLLLVNKFFGNTAVLPKIEGFLFYFELPEHKRAAEEASALAQERIAAEQDAFYANGGYNATFPEAFCVSAAAEQRIVFLEKLLRLVFGASGQRVGGEIRNDEEIRDRLADLGKDFVNRFLQDGSVPFVDKMGLLKMLLLQIMKSEGQAEDIEPKEEVLSVPGQIFFADLARTVLIPFVRDRVGARLATPITLPSKQLWADKTETQVREMRLLFGAIPRAMERWISRDGRASHTSTAGTTWSPRSTTSPSRAVKREIFRAVAGFRAAPLDATTEDLGKGYGLSSPSRR